MRRSRSLVVAVGISARSSPELTNVSTAVVSLVLTPMLEALLLVAVATSMTTSDVRASAYASVVLTFGVTTLTTTVSQVTRDRQLRVLQDVLAFGVGNLVYWVSKLIVPLVVGAVPALLGVVVIYELDPAHDGTILRRAALMIPVAALGGALTGVVAALTAIPLSDPYMVANVSRTVLLITAGVVLPLAQYPAWLRNVAEMLPFTNVVQGVRGAYSPGRSTVREMAICALWFCVGIAVARSKLAKIRSAGEGQEIW